MNKNINDYEILIINYIQKTYKVSRVKYKKHFSRAIILDDGSTYLLKNNRTMVSLKFQISHYIQLIFPCDETKSNELISKALNI